MSRKFTKEERDKFQSYFRKAVYIAGSLVNLSEMAEVSLSTINRLATGNYMGTLATRIRIEMFVEYNKNLLK